MKTFFVGIDISKSWLDLVVCDEDQDQVGSSINVENSSDEIKAVCEALETRFVNAKLWFCAEHTGSYGLVLCQVLEDLDLTYSIVPPLEIKQSIGMTRGKNDQIDAKRIAEYAAMHAKKLVPTALPKEKLLRVKSHLTYRDQLVRMRQQLKNSKKSHIVSNKSYDISNIIGDIDARIESLNHGIKSLDDTIENIMKSCPKLNKNYKKAQTVKGVGPLISAYMIVYTNNFTSFQNPRKFNCFAGLAPFQYSSGSSITGKAKTSQLRNKMMKKLLFNGANTAIIHDQELKAYYKRKINEGKHHMSVTNAIACKLVSRIFAVVKREEPFVNLVR
ncbi:MAG: IS110 family transposase [Fluviicola sp.]